MNVEGRGFLSGLRRRREIHQEVRRVMARVLRHEDVWSSEGEIGDGESYIKR